jgi:hypothetical protein
MRGLFLFLTLVFGISLWVCGVATLVTIVASVLKLCGLELLAGMSYWLPVKFAAGWIASFLGTAVSAALFTQ